MMFAIGRSRQAAESSRHLDCMAAAAAARRRAVFAMGFRSVGTGRKSFPPTNSGRVVWITASIHYEARQEAVEVLKDLQLEQRGEASGDVFCLGFEGRILLTIRTKVQKLLWQGSTSEPPGLSCERIHWAATFSVSVL